MLSTNVQSSHRDSASDESYIVLKVGLELEKTHVNTSWNQIEAKIAES